MKYKVSLGIFEGSLDLFLHLIREHKLDIYDIPVPLVTEQYIKYMDLMKAFKEVMKKISRLSSYKLEFDEISVSDKMDEIRDILKKNESVTFEYLLLKYEKKFKIVAIFLALLELTKQNEIRIYQTNQFGFINIMKKK